MKYCGVTTSSCTSSGVSRGGWNPSTFRLLTRAPPLSGPCSDRLADRTPGVVSSRSTIARCRRVQPFEPVSRGARIDPRDHHAILVVADRHLGELLQRSSEERGDAEQQHGQGQLRHHQQASGRMAAAFASHDPAERIQGLGWIHT